LRIAACERPFGIPAENPRKIERRRQAVSVFPTEQNDPAGSLSRLTHGAAEDIMINKTGNAE
jgi:hypothetical protein